MNIGFHVNNVMLSRALNNRSETEFQWNSQQNRSVYFHTKSMLPVTSQGVNMSQLGSILSV